MQLTDTTLKKAGNTGRYLLPGCRIFCKDKNNNGKLQNFKKSTKMNSHSSESGATSSPPIGDKFFYI